MLSFSEKQLAVAPRLVRGVPQRSETRSGKITSEVYVMFSLAAHI